jgi:alpha-tubulin suppressor-like RCC1 family protein
VRFTSIATGDHHSLAIGSDGRTYAWGKDEQGQLGDDAPLANQPTPVAVAVPAGIRFTQVAGGGDFSLAVGTDGRGYSWGDDSSGSLGDNAALVSHPTPTTAATPAGRRVLAVSAGYYHGLALLAP